MRFIKFLLCAALSVGLLYIFQSGAGPLPPPGKFFSPFSGFWQNAEVQSPEFNNLRIPGLRDEVQVVYDDRHVPHIFAKNEHDLFMAQGYVTASMRLFQMELQTHAAAGRISELIGERGIAYDRLQRRKGLMYGAELALQAFKDDTVTLGVLEAYTAGINAYVSKLSYADYPLEYKLLNCSPEPWTALKSALLLKYMADLLTGNVYDVELTNALASVGRANIELMFPDFPDTTADPVIPVGTAYAAAHMRMDTMNPYNDTIPYRLQSQWNKETLNLGSNNWAVNGKKTATGSPILCNDPHLPLNLPSLWFEIQLHCPDYNAYGVSLPGSPAIIIGFNDSIAWGVTNGTEDVKDYYRLTYADNSKSAYVFDNETRQFSMRVETIRVKGWRHSLTDTVKYTHFGPVVYEDSLTSDSLMRGLAMRWMGHDPSNELFTFYLLNKARNYSEYVNALQYFVCPAQNFVFASRSGDIALWHNGKFPARWPGMGKFVMDGSSSAYQWQQFIPHQQNPHVLNPDRNFVSSANQHPTDETYPYFYSGAFEFYRNRRINERLRNMSNITPEDMMKLQNDNYNLRAAESVPVMLETMDASSLSPSAKQYLEAIRRWNYSNEAGELAAAVYEAWFDQLEEMTWDEFRAEGQMTIYPQEFYLIRLMKHDKKHPLFDIRATSQTEGLKELLNMSLEKAAVILDSMGKDLTWAKYRNTSITHLLRLAPFSISSIESGGNRQIVNATGRANGPSWRMIVSMGDEIRAYGIYPGGQSGNPGSYFYRTGVEKWTRGEYFELLFLSSENDPRASVMKTQILKN